MTRFFALLVCLSLTPQSTLSADWTGYLKGLPKCNLENISHSNFYDNKYSATAIIKTLPKTIRSDVVGFANEYGAFVNAQGDTLIQNQSEDNQYTLYLKNSTAFGYPIAKIGLDSTANGRTLSVYFKQKPTNALPKFGTDKKGYAIVSVYKDDKTLLEKRVPLSPTGDYARYFKAYKKDSYTKSVFSANQNGWSNYQLDWGTVASLRFDPQTNTVHCFTQADS